MLHKLLQRAFIGESGFGTMWRCEALHHEFKVKKRPAPVGFIDEVQAALHVLKTGHEVWEVRSTCVTKRHRILRSKTGNQNVTGFATCTRCNRFHRRYKVLKHSPQADPMLAGFMNKCAVVL